MIKFHLLNASNKLSRYESRLMSLSESAILKIQKQLPIEKVDIVFYYNPNFIIPEVGMCGNTFTAHEILVSLDPDNENFEKNLAEELLATLAHELHHCMRMRGVGCGKTLKEALVTDGLARCFETEFRPNNCLPSYHKIFSVDQLKEVFALAKQELENLTYDHNEWFFKGSSIKGIPPFTGYTLGYEIVKKFIDSTGRPAGELWNEPADLFYKNLTF